MPEKNMIEEILWYAGGKLKKRIDITLINEIVNNLENILMKRENNSDRSHIDYSTEILKKMQGLNKTQLEYLGSSFIGLIIKYADLYQSAFDNPEEFCKRVNSYKQLFEDCKKINEKSKI